MAEMRDKLIPSRAPFVRTDPASDEQSFAPHRKMVELVRQLVFDPAEPEKSEHAYWATINSLVACFADPKSRASGRDRIEHAWLKSQTTLLVRNLDAIALLLDLPPRQRREAPASYARRIADVIAERARSGDRDDPPFAGRGIAIH